MALSKSDLKGLIYNEMNAIEWDDDLEAFKYTGSKTYDSVKDTGEIRDLAEFQAEVMSYSIIDHFEGSAEINVTDVQLGTDTATGTIT